MPNRITQFIQEKVIKPQVDAQTARMKKELNRLKSRQEEKDFDMITSISDRFGVSTHMNKRQLLGEYVSWAYANISVIAEKVADIQLEMYRVGAKGELQELENHPALELLLRVNDYQTKWDIIFQYTYYMLSIGEAAWYLVGMASENSKPTEIWSLRPDYLKIIPGDMSKNEFVKQYEYHIPGKEKVIFMPWEIIFFKNPHPTNSYRGYGVLEAAATDVDIDQYANDYNKNFFANYARPDAVLMTDGKLSEEVYNRVANGWSAKYQGTENAGKTAILEQGLKYQAIQPNAKDMDFLEQQRWTRDKIMALFKNTKVILGITEDVNRANAEAGEYVWLKHNIRPKMQRLVDVLNEFFIPIYGDDLFLGFEDPVPEASDLKIAEYTAGVDKWITRNEIREEEGLEPVSGGDYLYVPITNIPVGAGNPNLQEGTTPPTEEPKYMKLKVKKGHGMLLKKRYANEIKMISNRKARNKTLTEAVNKIFLRSLKAARGPQVKDFPGVISKEVQQKRWETFVKLAGTFEKQLIRLVEAIISSHENETLKLIAANYKPKKKALFRKKAVTDLVPENSKYVKVSVDAMRPIFVALAEEQGQDIFEFLGINNNFEVDKEMLRRLNTFALASSNSYVGTMRDRIVNALVVGIEKGEGIEKLQSRIRDEYAAFTRPQAERVARTESIRAANAATEEGFKQSGVVSGKQWFTAEDERVDDECADLDGKIVELDSEFAEMDNGPEVYSNIGYPPLHVNCRCTISPVIVEKSARITRKKTKRVIAQKPSISNISSEERAKIKEEIRSELAAEVKENLKDIMSVARDDK